MSPIEQGKNQEYSPTPFRRDRFHVYLRSITNGNNTNLSLWNLLSEVAKDAIRYGVPEGSLDRLEPLAIYLANLRMEMGSQFHLSTVVDRFLGDLNNVGLTQEKPDIISLLLKVRSDENILTHQGFVLDRANKRVEKPNGQIVTLSQTELDVFLPLISLAGQLVPIKVLTKPFKHLGKDHVEESLYMYILYLRQKLDEKDKKTGRWRWITNVPRLGYVFDAPQWINVHPNAPWTSTSDILPASARLLQMYINSSVDEKDLPVPAPNIVAKPLQRDLARLGVIKTNRDRRIFEDIDLAGEIISACGFTLDLASREVKKPDGQATSLTETERDLFALLLRNPGKLLPRAKAMHLFGNSYLPAENLRTFIVYLRQKLDEKDPSTGQWRWIKTVKGEGYIFGKQ